MLFLLLATASYLTGSLSSAIILCRLAHLPDPREQGSGNPGATNVLRIAGKKMAGIVLVLDATKGLVPVLVAKWLGLDDTALAVIALVAVIGHVYPVFFHFKGGKGVATTLGSLFGLHVLLGFIAIAIWLTTARLFRYSSLAAIIVCCCMPLITLWLNPSYLLPLLTISSLVLWQHRDNIKRLLAGTEPPLR